MRFFAGTRRGMVVIGLLSAWLTTAPLPASALDLTTLNELIGQVEGPTVILDKARWPKRFGEAPQLKALVRQGKLPPIEQRLPQDLMVLRPLHQIGKYGGMWRRGFTGAGDDENANRINGSDRPVLVDFTGAIPEPSLVRGWEQSSDGRSYTLLLRRGLRWSDGMPFTADDFIFWYEEIYGNRELSPTPMPDLNPQGRPARMVRIDDHTVRFEFEVPFPLFEELMMGDTMVGGGQSVRQTNGYNQGTYAPAHYLKQFLPKFAGGAEALDARAKAEGFDGWTAMFYAKRDWTLNPDLPVVGPFRTTMPMSRPTWVLERNPYYWAVDTAGNQLPYLDGVVLSRVDSLQELNYRALAGEYDLQERHIDLGMVPLFLQHGKEHDYRVRLDLGEHGADAMLHFNLSHVADPEIGRLIRNVDFRRALSLATDRDQINEAFFLGMGTAGSAAPADDLPTYPGPGWRERWSVLDLPRANQLLDKIGLSRKDAEGYRLRNDNGERLVLEVQAVDALLPWPGISQMVAQQWAEVGIAVDVRTMQRAAAFRRVATNEHQLMMWSNNGTERLFLFPRLAIPVDPTDPIMGPELARWYASGGRQGMKPDDPALLTIMDLYGSAMSQNAGDREQTARKIWEIVVDQQYGIGIVGQSPAFMGVRIVSNRMGNVPVRTCIAQHCRSPASAHPETFFFK